MVRGAADEGPAFQQTLQQIAAFYTQVMGGRVRADGAGVLLKWSRDWEYPWVLTRAAVRPGVRVLDCGAGNSPMPYLWAQRGALVVALDRDAVVATRARYAARVVAGWLRSVAGLSARASEAVAADTQQASKPVPPARGLRPAKDDVSAAQSRRSLPIRAWRFLRFNLATRHKVAFARIVKPDFWGPVSPDLLARYGVDYIFGDLTQLPFPSESFDIVTCISVLEHMPPDTRAKGVAEMARVLKPEGRLILTYDRHEDDLTNELIAASGLDPRELACLEADAPSASGRRRPDAIGMHLAKPSRGLADSPVASSPT